MQYSSLAILSLYFPGAVFLTLAETGRALGIDEKTIRNELSCRRFPVATVKRGGKRLVPISELAKYLDELAAEASVSTRRGRPRRTNTGA